MADLKEWIWNSAVFLHRNASAYPLDEEFPRWILGLVAVQLLLILGGLFGFFLFGYVFWTSPRLFHSNLIAISVNSGVLFVILLTCRLVLACATLWDWRIIAIQSQHILTPPFLYVELVRVGAGYASIAGVAGIVGERVMATVGMGTYEKKRHPAFVVAVISSTWAFGIISSFFSYGRAHACTFTIVGISAVVVFVCVGYNYAVTKNKRRVRTSQIYTDSYTLAARFQLQENRRMLRVMRKCVQAFVPCMCVLSTIWFIQIVCYLHYPRSTLFYFVRGVSHLASCVNADLLLFKCATGTYVWTIGLQQLLQQSARLVCPERILRMSQHKVTPAAVLTNTDGRQLAVEPNQEGQLYFSQLEHLWNAV